MQVDLQLHPEYWDRLGALPEAIRFLVEYDDPEPYASWLRGKRKELTDSQVAAQIKKVRAMIDDIRFNGYDEERWKADTRNWSGPGGDWFGPIVVTLSGTSTAWPWDGAHRSCILRCLGKPVTALVRNP